MSIKARILLVEDDTNLGFVIADQLKSEGYQVVLCTNGQDGHIRFTEEEFHLCLFDVMLPKKDGFTLAKEIRKINATIPIFDAQGSCSTNFASCFCICSRTTG
jgi:DNA-binding response OmpR family regulator